MPPLDTKRLFIAIELPATLKAHLESYQKELNEAGADVKWTDPQNIHLTLKFLGKTPTDKIPEIITLLDRLSHQYKHFRTHLNQLGFFPPQKTPRVIWAGLDEQKQPLKEIAAFLEEALSSLGFEKETRVFQAHITLGRIRSSRNTLALIEKINHLNEGFQATDLLIDTATLFESQLSPHGPTYSVIHQTKLL
jgi:2'-5' RNA ligase